MNIVRLHEHGAGVDGGNLQSWLHANHSLVGRTSPFAQGCRTLGSVY